MLPRYVVTVSHAGLGKHRTITGTDRHVVESKAWAQQKEWEDRYAKQLHKESLRLEKLDSKRRLRRAADEAKQEIEDKIEEAAQRTDDARASVRDLETVLAHTFAVNDAIDWESLKVALPRIEDDPVDSPKLEDVEFKKPAPQPPEPPVSPREPQQTDRQFTVHLSFWDKLIPARAEAKKSAAWDRFKHAWKAWQRQVLELDEELALNRKAYKHEVASFENEKKLFIDQVTKRNSDRLAEYNRRRTKRYVASLAEAKERNAAVDAQKQAYLQLEPDAIQDYCDLVLSRSQYPDCLPKEWDMQYLPKTKTLIVDYQLPNPSQLPRIKEVKYIKSRDEFKESELSKAESNALYDLVLYQVCLRTIHELIEADTVDAVVAVVFNGFVTAVDPRTGKDATTCVLSVHVSKREFNEINLESVDPKECFKALKGVGSSKLHGISAIAPVLQINKEDRRFVEAYGVADQLDTSVNLAAIDWEDFEHLVREVFESEFKAHGGEVKVTQASRDGGVDAIAFDPDPIRGGKLVIQAKRYTNTVGVGAVRDLYGTMINEGANRGILVTTSDFGPDSHSFAKNKPITLLSGANLLSLLEKHGHRAKIDLREAKALNAERQK
jgi:restriction system protein